MLASGRELLLYHRLAQPDCVWHLDPRVWQGGEEMLQTVQQSMLKHGYLLPDLVPVVWYNDGYRFDKQGCLGWSSRLPEAELENHRDNKHFTATSHHDFNKEPVRSPYNDPSADADGMV